MNDIRGDDRDHRPSTPNFDHLAPLYRWMEWFSFGPWLWLCRRAFLPNLTDRRHALVIGDGDGRFTASLLGTNPAVRIHAIDASPAMLRSLERRAGPHQSSVTTLATDARIWQPSGPVSYDLVATHFFLDCLTTAEIGSLAASIRPALAPGATWVVSEFAIPPTWFGRLIAQPIVYVLYLAFGWLTGLRIRCLPDHRAALSDSGFTLLEIRPRLCGLLISELWILAPGP